MGKRVKDKVLGNHYIVDLYGCSFEILNNQSVIRAIIHDIVEKIGAKLVAENYKIFSPMGISGYAIISESHISIHTWPEYQYAAVDVFSCKKIVSTETVEYIKSCFKAKNYNLYLLDRGIVNDSTLSVACDKSTSLM